MELAIYKGFDYADFPVLRAIPGSHETERVEMQWGFLPSYLRNQEEVKKFRYGIFPNNYLSVRWFTWWIPLNSGKQIFITVQKGHFQKQIVGADEWIATIPEFDSKEQPDIQRHYSYIGSLIMAILQNASTLSKDEFNQFYIEELLKKGRLGEKALEGASYQRVFRNTVGSSFELTKQKSDFPPFEDLSLLKAYPNWLAVKKETKSRD